MGKLALSSISEIPPPADATRPKATRNRVRGRKCGAWSGDWLRGGHAGTRGQGIAVTLSNVEVLSVPLTWLQTSRPIYTLDDMVMVTEPTVVQVTPSEER